jgi:predicted XRE-type DNA-binding protein
MLSDATIRKQLQQLAADNVRLRYELIQANMEITVLRALADPPEATVLQQREGHTAKLTEGQVREIRRQLRMGVNQKTIATQYKVHQSTISDIARGRTWRHVRG